MKINCMRFLVLYSCCLVLCSGAINRSVKTRRNSGAPPISRVCLVSLNADMSQVGMKGKEPLLPESEEWRGKLRMMLTHAMADAGWTVAQDLSAPEGAADEQLRAVVLRIRQRYDTVAVQLEKKPGKVEQGRYTLGDEVTLLPCSADADSLLFVHAEGFVKTDGRKLFSVLTGGSAGMLMASSTYRISIAFVDAKTGRVTAFTTISLLGGKVGKNPEKVLDDRLAEEFRKMHSATPKP